MKPEPNHYMDIGVVRIQSWLARTPRLRGRRGGSTLITQATDPAAVERELARIGDVAVINDEAGRVDGVVSLKLVDPDRAVEAEHAVVRYLRKHMPGASLSVTRFDGLNYAQARSENTAPPKEWPAPVVDWPAGRQCQWCSTWSAGPPRRPDEEEPLCEECLARSAAAGRAERQEQMPYAEKHLLDKLEVPLPVPDEFLPLARLDGRDETHLALIYADGNGIGKFIREHLRTRKQRKQYDLKISQRIDDATWGCLVDAVREVLREDDAALPIVPHTVGGDDVMVSLPAHRAWEFTRALLRGFDRHIRRQLGSGGPSLSAGVVFHHYKLPLFQITELAKRGLRQAKLATSGSAASLAWHDTTRDGREPVERRAVTFAALEEHWSALGELAALPNSARAQLENVVRAYGSGSRELRTHAIRVDSADLVRRFQKPINLADALGMARWWWR